MHATNHASHCPRTPRALPLRHCPLALALAACLTAGVPTAVMAQVSATQLPTGGSIVGGTGSINAASGGSQSITQTSNRMALTWSAFDIGSSATVTFNQPSSNAAVLNLIQGGNPTQIFGNLNANGQVFLINTNGMIFGSTAQINVGGLVASTLGTTASSFMTGNDVLDAGGNTVALMSNSGTINAAAGAVDLIGGKVVNHGTITASAGNINLVGADKVTLTFESGGFGVVVDKALPLQLDSVAVENTGTLSAPGGTITLQARAAQGLFDQLINNSGIIRAAAISGVDGSVSLIANGGGNVGIAGSGSIDVGNGAISISTDRSVQQSGVYTAGALGGSIGGSASFSGSNRIATLGMLDVGGTLSLTNANGLTQTAALAVGGDSTFSLASNALTLNNAANTFGGTFSATGGNVAVNAAGALTIGSLSQSSNSALSLNAGGRLTLPTSAINTGSADLGLRSGDSLSTAAALSGSNVSLTGTNGISLAHAVTATGTLALTSSTGAIDQTAGALTVTGTSTIDAGAGAINLAGANNDFGQAISLTGAGVRVVDRTTLQVASLTSAGNTGIDLQAGGSLILPVQSFDTGSADLNLVSGGGTLSTRAELRGRNVSLSGRDGITLNHDITSTGTLLLSSSAGNINQTGGLLDSGGTATAMAGGTLNLGRAGNEFRDSVSLSGTGITVVDQTDLVVSSLTSGANGAVSLTAGNALTLPTQAINTGSADLTLRANGGVLTSNGALTGNNVLLSGRDGISLGGNLTSAGTLELSSSSGAIVQDAGAIDATGAATVDAASGIALNAAGNDFRSTLSLSGNGISVVDQNDLTVSALSSGSNAAVSLTAGGALVVPAQAFNTGSADLTLIANGGTLSTAGTLSGRNITLRGRDGLTLAHDVTTSGTLQLGSDVAIAQTAGTLDVTGAALANAGGGTLSLSSANNDFRSGISLTGTGITVVDQNDLVVTALNSGSNGAVSLTAGGALTLPAQVIDTGSADLTLRANGGALTTGALAGRNLTLTGRDGVTFAQDVTSTGTLAVTTTNAAILQNGGVFDIGGTATLNAGTGAIALGSAGNDFRSGINLTGTGITVVDQNALTVSALSSGSNAAISLTAGGALTLPAQAFNTGSADLTLIANGGALSTAGTLSGRNITLRGRDGLTLAHDVTTSGTLQLGSDVAIAQTAGTLDVTGAALANAGGGTLSLSSANNDFRSGISLTGTGITLVDRNDLTVSALNSGSNGAVSLTAGGALTLAAQVIDTGSADLTLRANGGALTTGALAGRNLTLTGRDGVTFAQDVTSTGTLAVTTTNAVILQNGGVFDIGGAATLNAGTGAITLDSAGNDFRSGINLTGTGIAITDRSDLVVSSLSSGSNAAISLTAGGALVLPTQALETGSADLTLIANGGALATGGDLSGANVRLTARDGLVLGHAVRSTGTLSMQTTNANITQSAGAITAAGNTTINAGSGAVSLTSASNDFVGPLNLSGAATQVRDSNTLTLGTLSTDALAATSAGALNLGSGSVRGALTATSGNAAITQGGALSVGGAATLNAGSGDIVLTNSNNDFVEALSVIGNNVDIVDRNALAFGTVAADSLTTFAGAALDLGAGSIANSLSAITNNGPITQNGALSVGGIVALNAGTGGITLGSAGNVFQGALSLSGGATRISNDTALTFGTLSVDALTATSTGALNLGLGSVRGALTASSGNAAITQSGALSVGGPSSLNAGTAIIDLRDSGNDFGGAVTLTGGDVRLQDRNALALGLLSTGNLTAASVGALNLGSGTVAGTLQATSTNGEISQSGALNVAGASTLDAGTGSITLSDTNNALQGPVDLRGGATQLRNNTALTLGTIDTGALELRSNGALNLGSGRAASLIASSNGDAISQSGALAIAGDSSFDAGANTIRLTNAGNDFAGAVSLSGGATEVVDASALRMGTLNTGALTLASGGALTLGTGTVNGALVANANGAVDQNGALTVAGTSGLEAGTSAIALIDAGNDFGGAVSLSGGDTQIVDRTALTLGTLRTGALRATSTGDLNLGSGTIDGALTAQSNGGALTQTDALSVAGTATLDASSGNIALNNSANRFAGAVNLNGADVQIAGNTLTLGTLSTDALAATSAGALNLGSGSVRGALTATSGNAAIIQGGALSVVGAATLTAGSGDIVLTDANNDFGGTVGLSGHAIALQDRNDLSIAALQSGANAAVSLVAGGGLNLPVSQIDTGTAALTLAANGGVLAAAGPLRGGAVQLTGANGIALSNTLTAGTLTLTSTNAAITQSGGAVQVAGNAAVDAGSGAITLDAAGNDFQGVLALRGGGTTVRDSNALSLGTLDTGSLQVTSTGAMNLGVGLINGDLVANTNGGVVTQSGALTITGSTRINSSGAGITLDNAGNDFQSAVSLSGGDSRLRDRNALALGTLDVGALDVASTGGLDLGQGRIGGTLIARTQGGSNAAGTGFVAAAVTPLATGGAITQQGALTVAGTSVLDAGSGAIVLTDANNDFQGNVQATGGSIAIVDRDVLAVSAQATDALNLQAGTQLASTGTLSGGSIALSGGSGVVLGHDINSAGNVALRSGGAIIQTGGSLTAGRLSGSAAGPVTLTGANNAIAVLGDFSAQGLDVVSNRTLLVNGRVDGGASLRLRSGGELLLEGQLSGASSWLQAVAGIRQRAGSWIEAGLLSGSAGGAVVLGDAASFIDNRIGRLGNFTAGSGFSLTNAGNLLLVLANGSSYSVDAGNSPLFLSVRGDLLQDGRATLRNGTGTYAATGRIGTQDNPLYVIGSGTQTISAVGAPPAYFNATTADGGLLDLAGTSGFNVPTSAFAARAQSSASRVVAFVDLSASGTPYRAFGLVRPGLRLPDDQQPACDAGDPDAVCSPP
ncbi:filamentous hemagglutinin N-terminal domain-containing protein [Xanthomonas campestris]|uniref:two-partner secretion domain-containing protein n=1 Tax=Xanthomonas TaxID=338 RepID=UPI001E467A2A|nr:filamentous hemagglutinin N-terminal domain-containing protein [Xanthomonas campestris]MCC5090870.1 filamentous hemagglutinin N-terminal domain-containing protein [Xanthomonas campestris]